VLVFDTCDLGHGVGTCPSRTRKNKEKILTKKILSGEIRKTQ
jgi:hypothetical protein